MLLLLLAVVLLLLLLLLLLAILLLAILLLAIHTPPRCWHLIVALRHHWHLVVALSHHRLEMAMSAHHWHLIIAIISHDVRWGHVVAPLLHPLLHPLLYLWLPVGCLMLKALSQIALISCQYQTSSALQTALHSNSSALDSVAVDTPDL